MNVKFVYFLLLQILVVIIHAVPEFVHVGRRPLHANIAERHASPSGWSLETLLQPYCSRIDHSFVRTDRPLREPRAVEQLTAVPQQADIYAALLNATGGWIAYLVQVPGNPNGVLAYSQASIAQTAAFNQDSTQEIVLAPAFVKHSKRDIANITNILMTPAATVTALQLNNNGTITYRCQLWDGTPAVMHGSATISNIDQMDRDYPPELILLLTSPSGPIAERSNPEHAERQSLGTDCNLDCPEGSWLEHRPKQGFCACVKNLGIESTDGSGHKRDYLSQVRRDDEIVPFVCLFACPKGSAVQRRGDICSCNHPSSINVTEQTGDSDYTGSTSVATSSQLDPPIIPIHCDLVCPQGPQRSSVIHSRADDSTCSCGNVTTGTLDERDRAHDNTELEIAQCDVHCDDDMIPIYNIRANNCLCGPSLVSWQPTDDRTAPSPLLARSHESWHSALARAPVLDDIDEQCHSRIQSFQHPDNCVDVECENGLTMILNSKTCLCECPRTDFGADALPSDVPKVPWTRPVPPPETTPLGSLSDITSTAPITSICTVPTMTNARIPAMPLTDDPIFSEVSAGMVESLTTHVKRIPTLQTSTLPSYITPTSALKWSQAQFDAQTEHDEAIEIPQNTAGLGPGNTDNSGIKRD